MIDERVMRPVVMTDKHGDAFIMVGDKCVGWLNEDDRWIPTSPGWTITFPLEVACWVRVSYDGPAESR
jgi:hypothetical protein